MKEIELIDNFCDFLGSINIEYKRELRRGSYHNEGYIDIVIKNEFNQFIAVEAKINAYSEVLRQACRNWTFHYSYILYPREPLQKLIGKTKKWGIGLIIPKDKNLNEFYVRIKPKWKKFQSNFFYNYSKKYRNWVEDRIGRKFSEKEIPKDYNSEKLKSLEPTYNWGIQEE